MNIKEMKIVSIKTKEMDLNSSKNKSGRRCVLGIFEIIYDTLVETLAVLYCIVFVMPFYFVVGMGQYNYATRWDILRERKNELNGLVFGTCKHKEICESYKNRDELCEKKAGYGGDCYISFILMKLLKGGS